MLKAGAPVARTITLTSASDNFIVKFTRDKAGGFTKKLVQLKRVVKIGNIWKYVVGGGNSVAYGTNHPAGFPEKLVHDHIVSWSNEGDIILEPFLGSGSVVLSCLKYGRQFIGFEISQPIFKVALKRIEKIKSEVTRADNKLDTWIKNHG